VPSEADNESPPPTIAFSESELKALHREIDECRRCAANVPSVEKITGIARGEIGNIVVVGEGPGRKEKDRLKAFSGPSGKRLNHWLIACGADPASPRSRIYCTSVTKCIAPSKSVLPIIAANCRPFLFRQLSIIRPGLVITLGQLAYETLSTYQGHYSRALCSPIQTAHTALFSNLGFDYILLPWPHPSPRNRWLNERCNRAKLEWSFDVVKPFLARQHES
jgi:uracil-DNA glycosylase family 4